MLKTEHLLSVFKANGRRGLMIMQLIDCADEDLLEGKVIQGEEADGSHLLKDGRKQTDGNLRYIT